MLMPRRRWKDIAGYEGKYQVSNIGEVRSLDYKHTGEMRMLKQATDRKGYKNVYLYKDGKRNYYKVHRLVAEAFLSNPNGLPQVNHKDEDKTNNLYTNLEWCTCKYNINYGEHNRRVSEAFSKPIKCITTGETFNSITEASRYHGIADGSITKCAKGRLKSAGKDSEGNKLLWKYIDYE